MRLTASILVDAIDSRVEPSSLEVKPPSPEVKPSVLLALGCAVSLAVSAVLAAGTDCTNPPSPFAANAFAANTIAAARAVAKSIDTLTHDKDQQTVTCRDCEHWQGWTRNSSFSAVTSNSLTNSMELRTACAVPSGTYHPALRKPCLSAHPLQPCMLLLAVAATQAQVFPERLPTYLHRLWRPLDVIARHAAVAPACRAHWGQPCIQLQSRSQALSHS